MRSPTRKGTPAPPDERSSKGLFAFSGQSGDRTDATERA